jgi:DNA-binding GntR family transcriptional regulator
VTALTREDGPFKKSDAAYEQLKQLVVTGQARPGKHLNAQEVAELLGISVTPLRDAMVRLATEGFLNRESSYGFSTKEMRIEEERQIIEVCDIHFSAGLRISGGRASDHVRAYLAELTDNGARTIEEAMEVAGRIREMYLDVARASGNEILLTNTRVLVDRSQLVRTLDLQLEEPGGKLIEDLRAIGAAMSSGDPESAVEATHRILNRRIERLPLLVKEANFIASQASFP